MFEILNTVSFEEQGARTKLTIEASVLTTTDKAPRHLAGMEQGWSQSLERLADEVAR